MGKNLPQQHGKAGGFIYEVDSDNFAPAHNDPEEEWISKQPIVTQFDKTRFVTIDQVLQVGVQIFHITNTARYGRCQPTMRTQLIPSLVDGVDNGGIRWLNIERGINPIPLRTVLRRTITYPSPAHEK